MAFIVSVAFLFHSLMFTRSEEQDVCSWLCIVFLFAVYRSLESSHIHSVFFVSKICFFLHFTCCSSFFFIFLFFIFFPLSSYYHYFVFAITLNQYVIYILTAISPFPPSRHKSARGRTKTKYQFRAGMRGIERVDGFRNEGKHSLYIFLPFYVVRFHSLSLRLSPASLYVYASRRPISCSFSFFLFFLSQTSIPVSFSLIGSQVIEWCSKPDCF